MYFYKIRLLPSPLTRSCCDLTYKSEKRYNLFDLVSVSTLSKGRLYERTGFIFNISKEHNLDETIHIRDIRTLLAKADRYNFFIYYLSCIYYNIHDLAAVGLRLIQKTSLVGTIRDNRIKTIKSDNKIINLLNIKPYLRIGGHPGSGKTSACIDAINELVSKGKNVLFFFPERVLLSFFEDKFDSPFMYTGSLSSQQKHNIIKKINQTKGKVILATRSMIFMPLYNIDYVFVDESHDPNFDQFYTSFYNFIDLLRIAQSIYRFKTVYISATMTFKLYKKIRHIPRIIFYNKIEKSVKNVQHEYNPQCFLSNDVITKIKESYTNGNTTIIYINRRGHSSIVFCTECHETMMCPRCDNKRMIYHEYEDVLKCHTCSLKLDIICPTCRNTKLAIKGLGIERIKQQLKLHGLEGEISSSDILLTSVALKKFVKNVQSGKYKIIITTNIFIKSYHIPNVKFLVILNLERLPYFANQTLEQFFLMKQLIGRLSHGAEIHIQYLKWNSMYHCLTSFPLMKRFIEKTNSQDKLLTLCEKYSLFSMCSKTPLGLKEIKYIKERFYKLYLKNVSVVKHYYNSHFHVLTLATQLALSTRTLISTFWWLVIDFHYNL